MGDVSLPAAVDPAAGYWNFTALTLVALFIIYIVKKGELQNWASILFYQVAQIPTVANPTPNVPDITPGTPPSLSKSINEATAPDAASKTGPTTDYPNVAPGQNTTYANDRLNQTIGTPSGILGKVLPTWVMPYLKGIIN